MSWSRHFALPRRPIYFNCAAQGPMPRVALAAVEEAIRLKAEPHRIDDDLFFRAPARLRRALARLLHCHADEIALGTGASFGLNLAANGLGLGAGDEVVIPAGEFPANDLTFRFLGRRGVLLRAVPPRPGERFVREEDLIAALGPKSRVLTVGWVHYVHGYRYDLARLGRAAHERNVYFVVDATQGVGALPLDLREVEIDLLACAAHKWLLGPYGIGFAVVRRSILDRLEQKDLNWFSVRNCDDFASLGKKPLELEPDARRFDAPEPASFFNVLGLAAAIEFLLAEAPPETVFAHVDPLLDRLVDELPRGIELASCREPGHRSTILALRARSPSATARRLATLRRAGIAVAVREESLRISPHVYNDAREIDRLIAAL